MNKIILSLFLSVSVYACVCSGDIESGFSNSKTHITQTIDEATDKIENTLIPAIERNTSDIQKQNEELKKLLKSYMREAEQKKEIIFLLQTINNLQ